MKIDAVQILNDRLFQRESVIDVVLDKHGNNLKAGETSRAPTTFPGNQFEEIGLALNRSNDDWLQHTQFTN
jgi:hypothetical protein